MPDAKSLLSSNRLAFDLLHNRHHAAVAAASNRLGPVELNDLSQGLSTVRLLLATKVNAAHEIRPFLTGDVGRIAARQSMLYAASHGWGRALEAHIAEATATFLRNFKPGREQCWVAEIEGVMAGAVFLTDEGGGIARLRLLHVEPFAQKRGIGDALVRQCITFASTLDYTKIILWTHTVLEPARRIYTRNGFECISSKIHYEFDEAVHGEMWCLQLREA